MDVFPGLVPTSSSTHTFGWSTWPKALKNQRCELIFFALCSLRQNNICTGTTPLSAPLMRSSGSMDTCVVYYGLYDELAWRLQTKQYAVQLYLPHINAPAQAFHSLCSLLHLLDIHPGIPRHWEPEGHIFFAHLQQYRPRPFSSLLRSMSLILA